MLSLKSFEFVIIKYAVIVALVGAVIGMFLGQASIALGIIVGVVVSSLNFILISVSVRQTVNLPPEKAGWFSSSRYLMRFLLIIAVLVAVAYTNNFGFFIGTVGGFVIIKLVIIVMNLTGRFNLLKEETEEEN